MAIAALAACGGTPHEASRPPVATPHADPAPGKLTTDPDLNRPPPTKLLSIDWKTTSVTTDAEALALWQRIAPTGEDWEAKLEEVPDDGPISSKLALALLHGGNFTCVPAQPVHDCSRTPIDIDEPLPQATFADPCLRRLLALWAINSLDETDLPAARDALRAIAAIPPPESQLVAAALDALPETDQDGRMELRAIAMRAGQRELVTTKLSDFDVPHLIEAVEKHHIDGALDLLPAESNRSTFLAAIADEQLFGPARAQAMVEVASIAEGPLPKDVHRVFERATKSPDCAVAAAAARILVQRGERKYGPSRPSSRTIAPMMRALCVLASYERMQQPDEPSYLLGYIPPKGSLELVKVTYDPYNDVDADGDGDPHTERTLTQVRRDEVVLPELEDMVVAFTKCTDAVCKSADHEFRFGFKRSGSGELMLGRVEVVERPPCTAK